MSERACKPVYATEGGCASTFDTNFQEKVTFEV